MIQASPLEPLKPFRQKAEEGWLRLIRAYTYNTPINKGKYRIYQAAMNLCRYSHTALPATTKDGRKLIADLSSGNEDTVFFHGEYEHVLTRIAAELIRPGDVCIDAGANFGWYTTLFSRNVGNSGSVHAFEPVPRMFRSLEENCGLLDNGENVFINRAALCDKSGTVTMNLFRDEPTGHASMASKGKIDVETFDCPMITLDDYLSDNRIGAVNFVKADIEGGELMFLQGARRLFTQDMPPIFLMEMALEATRHFGYKPNDLLAFIGGEADYLFYSVDEIRGRVKQITSFGENDLGANVFCIPRSASADHHRVIGKYLEA
jgi:FkbM family methyltransferase